MSRMFQIAICCYDMAVDAGDGTVSVEEIL